MKFLIYFSLVCALTCHSLGHTEAQQETVSHSFTIALPLSIDSPPYFWRSAQDGTLQGSTIDVYELMAQRLGYTLQWRDYDPRQDSAQVARELHDRHIDLFVFMLPPGVDDSPLIRMLPPFFNMPVHALVRADSPQAELTLTQLLQQRGSMSKGSEIIARSLPGNTLIELALKHSQPADDLPKALAAVLEGRADYSFSERLSLLANLQQWQLEDQLKIVEPPLAQLPTYIWFQRDSDFAAFQQRYLELGQQLHDNGQLEHIKQRNMRKYIREIRLPTANKAR